MSLAKALAAKNDEPLRLNWQMDMHGDERDGRLEEAGINTGDIVGLGSWSPTPEVRTFLLKGSHGRKHWLVLHQAGPSSSDLKVPVDFLKSPSPPCNSDKVLPKRPDVGD